MEPSTKEGSELGHSEVQVDGGGKERRSSGLQSGLPAGYEPHPSSGSLREMKSGVSFVVLKSRQGQVRIQVRLDGKIRVEGTGIACTPRPRARRLIDAQDLGPPTPALILS